MTSIVVKYDFFVIEVFSITVCFKRNFIQVVHSGYIFIFQDLLFQLEFFGSIALIIESNYCFIQHIDLKFAGYHLAKLFIAIYIVFHL